MKKIIYFRFIRTRWLYLVFYLMAINDVLDVEDEKSSGADEDAEV